MSRGTTIGWAGMGYKRAASWNPLKMFHNGREGWGCVKVDERCRDCYAETMNKRLGTGLPYSFGATMLDASPYLSTDGETAFDAPLRWKKQHGIFVGSMTDLFLENINVTTRERSLFWPREWLVKILTVMLLANHHRYALLTKRPDMMVSFLKSLSFDELMQQARTDHDAHLSVYQPLEHIAFGFSAGTQKSVDEALPHMRALREKLPDAILWASNEPCLERIDWTGWDGILSWLVTGGESGNKARIRPLHPEAARSDRNWCAAHHVPWYFKQWGEYLPSSHMTPNLPQSRFCYPWKFVGDDTLVFRVDRRRAGNTLDGFKHENFPQQWVTENLS